MYRLLVLFIVWCRYSHNGGGRGTYWIIIGYYFWSDMDWTYKIMLNVTPQHVYVNMEITFRLKKISANKCDQGTIYLRYPRYHCIYIYIYIYSKLPHFWNYMTLLRKHNYIKVTPNTSLVRVVSQRFQIYAYYKILQKMNCTFVQMQCEFVSSSHKWYLSSKFRSKGTCQLLR